MACNNSCPQTGHSPWQPRKKLHSHSKELITSCKQRCHLPAFSLCATLFLLDIPFSLHAQLLPCHIPLPYKKQRKQNRCDAQKWNCRRKIENAAHREISAVLLLLLLLSAVVCCCCYRGWRIEGQGGECSTDVAQITNLIAPVQDMKPLQMRQKPFQKIRPAKKKCCKNWRSSNTLEIGVDCFQREMRGKEMSQS